MYNEKLLPFLRTSPTPDYRDKRTMTMFISPNNKLLAITTFTFIFMFWTACSTSNSTRGVIANVSGAFGSRQSSTDNLFDVQNSTLGFQKAFVVSMPERVDKHDLWAVAALHTGLDYEFVDGVRGDTMSDKTTPHGWDYENETPSTLGCFRGHMNAIQKIVRDRISSAIVFEDDADWDVNLKQQLVEFARGSRYIHGHDPGQGLDSPYGSNWDFLWLGQCGLLNRPNEDQKYYVIRDDPTAITPTDLLSRRRIPITTPELGANYTRLVYEPQDGMCAIAYAVSLRGAQKILYHFSIDPDYPPPWDIAVADFCTLRLSDARCVGVYPSLFGSYRAPGNATGDSDRDAKQTWIRKKGETRDMVFPLRPNLGRYVRSDTAPIPASYPEEAMVKDIIPEEYKYPRGTEEFLPRTPYECYQGRHGCST